MAEEEKKDLTTLEKRNRWKRFYISLRVMTYVVPLLPASVIFGVNFNTWFAQGGAGVPTGLMFLLSAIGLGVVIILKKDEDALKKVSPLLFATGVVALLGVAFKALAGVNMDIGNTFLWSAGGLALSFASDQLRKAWVKPKLDYYQGLVDKYQLDEEAKKRREEEAKAKAEAEEQAQQEAEAMKKQQEEKQPTE